MSKLSLLTILLVLLMLVSCNNNLPSDYDTSSPAPLIEQSVDDIPQNENYIFLYQDEDTQYSWKIEDDNCVLYAVDHNELVRQLAIFPPLGSETNYIVDFGICGDWIIVSVGHYEGSGNYFYGDFARLKKDGSDFEHFWLTDNDTFVIVDDWIYYNFGTIQYNAEDVYGCYRIRPDGTEKEYMGDTIYHIFLYAEDGYVYGKYDTGETVNGRNPVTNLIRCRPDGSEVITLFSGDILPKFDDSSYIGYKDIKVADDSVAFTAYVHGYSVSDGWRGHTMYTADYRVDKDGDNLTLLSEDYYD